MKLPFKKQKKEQARQPRLMAGQEGYAFRRSRTLTGTTSAKVVSSAEARSQLKTPRLKEHELKQKRGRIVKLLLGMTACIVVLLFLLVNFVGSLTPIYPQPSKAQPKTSAYQETLRQYFAGRPFERFGFSLNASQLEQFMRDKHSEISTFSVKRAWYGGDVQFVATFRRPILVWQSGTQHFFVDDQGISFEYDHFGAQLVSVVDQSGVTPDAGNSVASKRFIHFLGKMVGAVNAGGKGKVISVIIPPSTREIDLKLEGREYPIKTHIDRDPLQQAEDTLYTLAYFDIHKIAPAYIDVRVSGKAFYK